MGRLSLRGMIITKWTGGRRRATILKDRRAVGCPGNRATSCKNVPSQGTVIKVQKASRPGDLSVFDRWNFQQSWGFSWWQAWLRDSRRAPILKDRRQQQLGASIRWGAYKRWVPGQPGYLGEFRHRPEKTWPLGGDSGQAAGRKQSRGARNALPARSTSR